MKKFYKLLNYEVSQYITKVLIICFGAIISSLFFVNRASNDYSNLHNRFETIYEYSGSIIIFVICFAAVCGICIQSLYSNYFSSKSIYTLITLPMKREGIYFSKLISYFIYFLMLYSTQLISVFISYALVLNKIAALERGKYVMNNGLFLAFLRSGFLRILLPLGLEGIISTISILIAIGCSLYYGLLCERSKRFWGFVLIIAVVFMLIRVITYRINQSTMSWTYINLYVYSTILFCFSGFFIWHGIKLIKIGAIV